MSDPKITFTGDTTSLVASIDRAQLALAKLRQQASGATDGLEKTKKAGEKAAKTLSSELGQTFAGMAKGVLVTAAITKGLEAAATAATKLRDARMKASEEIGGTELEAGLALRQARNITTEQRAGLVGMIGGGATTREQDAAFLSKLGADRSMTAARASNLMQAFQSGAFSEPELAVAMERRQSLNVGQRMASLTPQERAEIETRRTVQLQRETNRNIALAGSDGRASRLIEGEIERRQLESPAVQSVIELLKSLPGVGRAATATEAGIIERQQETLMRIANATESNAARRPAVMGGAKE